MRRIVFLFLILLGCSSEPSSKPIVLVMIPTYAYFVEQLAGEGVDIEVFVPPGANPHTYEPTPQQVERFARAKIWFRYGDAIEQKIVPFLQEKNVKQVDLSEGISLLSSQNEGCGESHAHEGPEEGKDRHIWMDPHLLRRQVRIMADNLSLLWPDQKSRIEAKYETVSNRLQALDAELKSQLEPVKGSYLLLSHPALGYFCERYGLRQLSVECEGKEPRPQQVAQIVEETKEHRIPVVITEPQYNNKGAVLISEKLGIPVIEINPYAFDYFETMHQITDSILKYYGHQS